MHNKSYKKSAIGRMLFACLLRLSMGETPLKSISFMKNPYLLFTVFYEIQYLSAGKEESQLLKSKVCDFRDLLYPFL